MNKEEFKEYIKDNPGFYKTRESHIKTYYPEILAEIKDYINKHKIEPFNFNDSLRYYVKDIKSQVRCKVCRKNIHSDRLYCSTSCDKKDVKTIINKRQKTLYEKTGSKATLGSKESLDKRKATCKKLYGVEHPSSNKTIKNKIKISNLKTYKDKEVRQKLSGIMSNVCKERNDEIVEKRKQTNFNKTGEYTTLRKDTIIKTKKTLNQKYGTTNPFKIHENTYQRAGLSAIKFFLDVNNKNKAIQKRLETIDKKYGSFKQMNELLFEKKKEKILQSLKDDGITEEVVEYKYSNLGFVTCRCSICKKEYEISFKLLRERFKRNDILCTHCFPIVSKHVSKSETELYNWLSTLIDCERTNRKKLKGTEIDIFVPNKNIGIEYNGIYWHSDRYKNKNFHLNKTLIAKKYKVNLIHIWEDLWETKKKIIKSMIKSKLDLYESTINVKDCEIKEIDNKKAYKFFEENHLEGKTNFSFNVGLFYCKKLISCLSIRKVKAEKEKYKIVRFCNKINVNMKRSDSFHKLFNYISTKFIGSYIYSVDLCWGDDNEIFGNLNFKLKEYLDPSYFYVLDKVRYDCYFFKKRRLIKLGYDKSKTEFEIMDEEIKALRIYDCGNVIWELNI